MKITKWSMSALLAAVLFFVGITSAYANVPVNVYLNPGTNAISSDERAYEDGERIAVSYWNSSSSLHTINVDIWKTVYTGTGGYHSERVGSVVTAAPGAGGAFDFYAPGNGYYHITLSCGSFGYDKKDCTAGASMDDYYN